MQFYQDAGLLVLGSRLKRLGDSFINDVNKIYSTNNIDFDASWFPVFYILSRKREVSIVEIANELNISHSAVSQMVKNLSVKRLLKSKASKIDGRQKVISFTANGSKLFLKIKPVWDAMQLAMEKLTKNTDILSILTGLEEDLIQQSLYNRIENKLSK